MLSVVLVRIDYTVITGCQDLRLFSGLSDLCMSYSSLTSILYVALPPYVRMYRVAPRSSHVTRSSNPATKPSPQQVDYLGYQSPPFAPAPTPPEAQGVLVRGIAWFIDSIVLGMVTFAAFIPVTLAAFARGSSPFAFFASASIWIQLFVVLALQFVYFTALEGRFGQTLGKFVSEVKVVREDGSPIGYRAAALRTILRLIDFLPVLYGVGALLIWSSDKRQRLGDVVAHTIVISHVRYTSV